MSDRITIVDYHYFNILNPDYSILQYGELERGQRFRYGKQWRIKVGDKFAKLYTPGIGNTYLEIQPDKYVFIFNNEKLYDI